MTRRHLLVFGLLVGPLALGVGGWLLLPTEPQSAIPRRGLRARET